MCVFKRRQQSSEETFTLKRKLLFGIWAVTAALLMPVAANCQIAPERTSSQPTGPEYKYHAFVGFGYTSLNQVSQSNSGLQGVTASVTRDWGRFFGVTVQGGDYRWTVTRANAGNPTVDYFLAVPVIHAPLYGPTSLFIHGLLGVAHTGGVSIRPDVSFAGGLGIGADYRLSPHFGIRLQGDDILSSFTIQPYQAGDSPHRHSNAHATIGVTYKF